MVANVSSFEDYEGFMQSILRIRRLAMGILVVGLAVSFVACSDEEREEQDDDEEELQWEYPDPYDSEEVQWALETGAVHARLPAVHPDGGLVFGDWNGVVRYVSPESGEVQWSFQAQGRIDTAPAIDDDGRILIADWEGYVYALTASGQEEWSYETGAIVDTSPTVDGDGRIWIAANDGMIHVLSSHGEVDEQFTLGAAATTSVSVFEDENGRTAFVGSADEQIHCIDDAGVVDTATIEGHARFDLALTEQGHAIATMHNGVIAAIDRNCDVLWEQNLTYATIMPAVISEGGDVWAWGHNRQIFLVQASTGDRLDQFDHLIRANATTAGTISDEGRVLVGTRGIVDFAEDGDASIRSEIDVMDAPILSGGAAFATTERGVVLRLAGDWPHLGDSSWPTQHGNLQRTGRLER